MLATRRHLRPLTWTALLAMLALALLPTLSHALAFAAGGNGGWAEVCTVQGTRLVALPAGHGTSAAAADAADAADGAADGSHPAPLQAHGGLQHCPLCALSAHALAAPPAPATVAVPPRLGHAPPALALHAPRTLPAWRSAQPRGPPAVV